MEPANDGTRQPRKVVFMFVSMPVGGAEDFALGVAGHLGPEFEAHFVCLRELGKCGEEMRDAGARVHLARFFPSKVVNPLNIRRFAAWLRDRGFALVHSQTHHAHVFATRAARLAGIPSVVHQQKTLEPLPWRKRSIFRGCLRRADRILALSPQTARDLQAAFDVPAEKVRVIPNAIDADVFCPAADRAAVRRSLGLPPEGLLLGTVARLHGDKNHAAIIGALSLPALSNTGVTAVFCGEGPLRSELENMAQAAGLGDRIIFAGRQRPVVPWIQSLDVFVLPSVWEGQPLALLQALACRVPVLASRIEGNTAVLGDDHPGLFDPKDHAALAGLIGRASDPRFRRMLIDHQDRIAIPSAREVASRLKAVYQSVLS